MFCRKCGAQLREESKFCLQCGAPVVRVTAAEPAVKPKSVRKTVITIAIVAAVVLFFAACWFVVPKVVNTISTVITNISAMNESPVGYWKLADDDAPSKYPRMLTIKKDGTGTCSNGPIYTWDYSSDDEEFSYMDIFMTYKFECTFKKGCMYLDGYKYVER